MKAWGNLLFIFILNGFCALRCGATVYHSDGSAASVQQIHNAQAVNGDTITLPAGAFTWTTGVTMWKAITLQGSGVGSTIVRDALPSGELIDWTLAANQVSRLTGIEFQDGGRTQAGSVMRVDGSNTDGSQFRWDNCKWNDLNGFPLMDTVIGVIDHNQFVISAKQRVAVVIYGSGWNGHDWGDGSWAAPPDYGGSQFLFMENNSFTNTDSTNLFPVTDSYGGGRFVVRHNSIYNCNIQNHGTESTERWRGGRATEVYDNTFTGTNLNSIVGYFRSGSVLFHDNGFSGYADVPHFTLICTRMFWHYTPWGQADGTSPWDVNMPGGPFYSGTATSGGNLSVTVTGANWITNQWAGYSIKRTAGGASQIVSNTAHTITYLDSGENGPNLSFAPGDAFTIYDVLEAIDQPGRGQGSLISGDNPIPPAGWNDQVTEPCYSWNNTQGAVHINFSASTGNIRPGEHYFNDTPMPGYTPYIYPHPLVNGLPRAVIADFNGDNSPDFLLQRNDDGETAIWYLNNNVRIDGDAGLTLPNGWSVRGAADFNGDGHVDYALFHSATNFTAIAYMSGPTVIGAAWGRTLPPGWELVGATDFNGDGKPDYVLYTAITRQTAIWYLNDTILTGGDFGPTIPTGWNLVGVADFNRDGHADYVLSKATTGETAIWYLSGPTLIGSANGPTIPSGWILVGTADFDGDGNPDFLLYNTSSYETAIWYLNNNIFVSSASGPTLPATWGWPAR
jgi:hypothetical protein